MKTVMVYRLPEGLFNFALIGFEGIRAISRFHQ
jgi:hypothetical protein